VRFLDKGMQQDQCIAFDRKQYPRTTQADMGAYFLQAWIKFPDQRHSHRPAILSGLDVFSDCFTVFSLEFLEPVSDRLVTAFCAMENDCQDGLVLSRIEFQAPGVSKMVRTSRNRPAGLFLRQLGQPNGQVQLRLRPHNPQSRELHRRSRQLDAMLGPALLTSPAQGNPLPMTANRADHGRRGQPPNGKATYRSPWSAHFKPKRLLH